MAFPNYRWLDFPAILGLAGLYCLLAKIVLTYFSETGNVTLVWFSGGLGLAALLLKGLRYWPGIFLGAFAAGLMVDDSFPLSFAIATGNTLESATAAYLLKNQQRFSLDLTEPGHFIWLTLTGAACSLISAGIGPLALHQAGFIPLAAIPQSILHWWMADAFGIVTATPILLVWRNWPNQWLAEKRGLEALLLIILTLFAGQVVFLEAFQPVFGKIARGYWMFLFAIWAALRFNRHGVTLIAGLITIQALFGAAHHLGFFGDDFEKSELLNLWFYILVLSWTGTTLALTLHKQQLITTGLADSERRLKAIIDYSPVPQAIYDAKGNFTLLNPAFNKAFGYTLDDIKSLDEWWPKAYPDPVYRRTIMENWQELTDKSRRIQSFETIQAEIHCKHGERRTVLAGSVSLGESYVGDNLAILFDITEQLKSEKALTESNLLLQTILETLPIRVFWKDLDSRYLGCNALFAGDAGQHSSKDLIGKDDNQLNWRDQAANYQADDRQVIISGKGKLAYEEPQTTPDGNTIWLRTSKIPLRNSDHEIIGVLGSYEDISENKAREDALAQSVSLLRATLEATADGILVVSLQRQIVTYNQRFFELWQLPNTAVGEDKDDTTLLHLAIKQLKNPGEFFDKVQELYNHPDQESYDLIEFSDGRIFERYSKPQSIADIIVGRVWSFRDVSNQHRAEQALQQKEYYQRALLDNIPHAIWLKDTESRLLAVNQEFANVFAAENPEALVGKNDFDIAPPELAESYLADDRRVLALRDKLIVEEEIVDRGVRKWFETYKAPVMDEQGQLLGTVGFARDISELRKIEENLRLAALVYHNSSEAMIVVDSDNTILSVNPAFTTMTGYTAEDVVGKKPHILSSGEHDAAFYRELWAALDTTGAWRGEIKNRSKDGRLFVEELAINTIYNAEGKPQRRVALFSDITQRKQSEEQIWRQANFDPLTGLPNRRMFRDRLELEIKKAHRMGQLFALLFIDLDRFKEINDTLGHDMGDNLLKETARRLQTCVRESDTVARLGGDEFTVILSELDCIEVSEPIAKNLLQKLSAPFSLDGELAYVSASIGITFYPNDSTDLSQLQKNADQAMYAAKNQGRNNYRFFTKALQDALEARAAILGDLRIALANAQFLLCYQPIVDLLNGEVHKAEALLRWHHPKRGLISPAEFIPLAEETGLIREIGDWVFETAARQVQTWRTTINPDFQISVNKSPVQFQSAEHAPEDWFNYLHRLGLSGQSIVVEITEGLLLDANLSVHNHLMAFRDAGMQVAIDDFGTGYSALSYLKKFDIDYLKIDQSFVRNLSQDSNDFVLCEAIIVMAHKLGLKVIAEGVETEQQRDLLAAIGCDYGQGYLFAKPLPAALFAQQFGKSA
ncbi:bifunctional diguanylate cyclase/phosphodiesterase [Methylomonas sp. 11b]|uniref:bifunctional diguanylate cyclase/phosphodiesterase n=1 Tax=Methylomonas sp. 11b TaxID=1168169 RepID=UPI000479301B|nr:EAL domain-containing protein [Methylomonas sp. 11b]